MADHVFVVMKWLHEACCDHIGYTHQYHYQLFYTLLMSNSLWHISHIMLDALSCMHHISCRTVILSYWFLHIG